MSQSKKYILDLTADEAHAEFLKNKNYCGLNLPPYFHFEDLLNKLSEVIKKQPLSLFFW